MRHPLVKLSFLLLLALSAIPACKSVPYTCQVMRDCCEVIKNEPGVGIACSKKMLDGVEDSDACVAVVQSVQAMFEEKDGAVKRHIPEQCILQDK